MPIDKRSVRVVLPSPDMQRIERRQSEAIRSFEQMKELPHELRRLLMGLVPCLGEHQIISADQLEAAVRHWLIDDDLRTSRVEDAAVHQVAVDVVKSHSSRIGAA